MYSLVPLLQKQMKAGKSFASVYKRFIKISVDYALLEKVKNVVVIPSDFGWSDIGDWKSVQEILAEFPEMNVARGDHIALGTQGAFVYSPDKLVVTIGLDDLIIVDTPDVLLVCPKDRAQDVKKIVKELANNPKRKRYL